MTDQPHDGHAPRIYEVRTRDRETGERTGILVVAESAVEAAQAAEEYRPGEAVVLIHEAESDVVIGPSVRFRVLEETGGRR